MSGDRLAGVQNKRSFGRGKTRRSGATAMRVRAHASPLGQDARQHRAPRAAKPTASTRTFCCA